MTINSFNKPFLAFSITFAGVLFSITSATSAEALTLTFKFTNVAFNDGGVMIGSFDYDPVTEDFSNVSIVTKGGNTSVFGRSNHYTSLSGGAVDYEDESGASYKEGTLLNSFSINEYGAITGFGITLTKPLNNAYVGQKIKILIDPGRSLEIADFPNYGLRYVTQGSVTAVPEPFTLLGAATALGLGTYFKQQLSKKHKKEKIKN
ncbi:hypothetical protein PCC7424_5101 [Gloeothece citriformis PCC 7424]|uniref:PEP-CTERM protein-sorting domain-containing protein n=1 Tax=Gloeothece citriformis (strain PCC 7424) TaxID=65393 RepID=B7KGW5_GLOC7|nr:PEP-CTERM sorting domain-containing protein [Gloeothece citriformis]ACK73452.1 hypothetical protein PCC7424_5101 [Gloeothece citriformis PCC 7424]